MHYKFAMKTYKKVPYDILLAKIEREIQMSFCDVLFCPVFDNRFLSGFPFRDVDE